MRIQCQYINIDIFLYENNDHEKNLKDIFKQHNNNQIPRSKSKRMESILKHTHNTHIPFY